MCVQSHAAWMIRSLLRWLLVVVVVSLCACSAVSRPDWHGFRTLGQRRQGSEEGETCEDSSELPSFDGSPVPRDVRCLVV